MYPGVYRSRNRWFRNPAMLIYGLVLSRITQKASLEFILVKPVHIDLLVFAEINWCPTLPGMGIGYPADNFNMLEQLIQIITVPYFNEVICLNAVRRPEKIAVIITYYSREVKSGAVEID